MSHLLADLEAPTNYEEYISHQQIDFWPFTVGFEEFTNSYQLFSSQTDITDELRRSSTVPLDGFDAIERSLDEIEGILKNYTPFLVTTDREKEWLQGRLCRHRKTNYQSAFLTEVESLSSDVEYIEATEELDRSEQLSVDYVLRDKGTLSVDDGMNELGAKKVESCKYPGFHHGELTELPGQLDAPVVLNRVTEAQKFKKGFRSFWKKLFLSEASIALMKDLFWWIFIDRFSGAHDDDKDNIFNRISDNYFALFVSIHPSVKDKFLQHYPDCLAQSIYEVFAEAFSESLHQFDDDFKQRLFNIVTESLMGLKLMPGLWKNWKFSPAESVIPLVENATVLSIDHCPCPTESRLKLETDKFNKNVVDYKTMLTSLGESTSGSRELVQTENNEMIMRIPSTMSVNSTHFFQGIKSHQIGPGKKFERVKFDVKGLSPLIRNCIFSAKPGAECHSNQIVTRTEVAGHPSPRMTYRQVIKKSELKSKMLKNEYEKICEDTNAGVQAIQKKMNDHNKTLNRMERALKVARTTKDLEAVRHKLAEFIERNLDKTKIW